MLTRTVIGLLIVQAALYGAEFEALSVRPSEAGKRNPSMRGGPGTDWPDRLTYSRVTLKELIEKAYAIEGYQVIGPSWIETERYDLAAKLPPGTTKEELGALLQKALKERFSLTAHRESRVMPVYALSITKGGPKLAAAKPLEPTSAASSGRAGSEDDDLRFVADAKGIPELPKEQVRGMRGMILPGKAGIRARRQTMQELAKLLTGLAGRPVLDRTLLRGEYDFTLTWMPETRPGLGPLGNVTPPDRPAVPGGNPTEAPVAAEPGLTIFAAVESQLGLTLKGTRAAVEVLTVDHAEKAPTAN